MAFSQSREIVAHGQSALNKEEAMFTSMLASVTSRRLKQLTLGGVIAAACVTSLQVGTAKAVFDCPYGDAFNRSITEDCKWCWAFWRGKYIEVTYSWDCPDGSHHAQIDQTDCGACNW